MPKPPVFPSSSGLLRALRHEQRGATAVEYSLIVTVIALAAAGALSTVGVTIGDVFDTIASNMLSAR